MLDFNISFFKISVKCQISMYEYYLITPKRWTKIGRRD